MRGIIFVDRDSLFYFGGDTKSAVQIQLPPAAIRDMEVIDVEELAAAFTKTIQTNKLKPVSTLIVFSNRSYFQKPVEEHKQPDSKKTPPDPKNPPPSSAPKELDVQIAEFIETVPFNRVLSKTFTQGKQTKIIAINRDYAYALRDILEKSLFKVEGIVPTFALYGDQNVSFSAQAAQQMIKHFSSLSEVSFPVHETDRPLVDTDEEEFNGEKKDNKRLFMMIGIFSVLIIVLVYMFFFYNKSTPVAPVNNSPTTTASTTQNTPSPTPTEEPATPTPAPAIAKEELTFQVLNGSGVPGQADRVQERLAEAGFQNIEIGNAPTQGGDSTSVVFKPEVARIYREEIITMIKSLGFEVTTRENEDIDPDVLITTYQSSGQESEDETEE